MADGNEKTNRVSPADTAAKAGSGEAKAQVAPAEKGAEAAAAKPGAAPEAVTAVGNVPTSSAAPETAQDAAAPAASAGDATHAAPASADNPVRIAVFDFDGTLINAQSGTLFTKYLLFHGYITPLSALKVILWGARYTLHLPHDQNAVRGYLIDDLSCRSREEVMQIMARFHDEVLTRHYRSSGFEQIRACHEDGCVCVLVSATFYGIAQAAARHAGLDAFLATRMEVTNDGRITGKVRGFVVEGEGKIRVVDQWADETYGPGNWVIEYAFGDHHSDEEMLAAAQHPYAVNPGRTLRSIARRHGWPVILWS